MRETDLAGQTMAMIWLLFGAFTLLYLLFWPFTLRLDARLSPTAGRGELTVASLFHLRLEGDFLQPPYLHLSRLDAHGRRRPLKKGGRKKSGFRPVILSRRLTATLHIGMEGDGALTVETLGLLYAVLETFGRSFLEDMAIRPTPCFDKTICALRLSGIGRFVLAQNIWENLKGKNRHAKR